MINDKDDKDDKDEFVPYDHLSSKTRLLKSISELERDADEPETSEPRSGNESVALEKTSIDWKKRVLGWFRRK